MRKVVKWFVTAIAVVATGWVGYGLFAIFTWKPLRPDVHGFPADGTYAFSGALPFIISVPAAILLWRSDRRADRCRS